MVNKSGFFRALAENVPDIVFTITPEGTTEYYNTRWYQYTGLPLEPAFTGGHMSFVHPKDIEQLNDHWQRVKNSFKDEATEARYLRHDGSYRWQRVNIAPFYDEAGALQRWIGTISDIHAERSAERSFRTLAETVHTLVWAASPDGFVDYFNVRWQERICDVRQLVGDGWTSIVHPDDLANDAQAWKHSIATGQDYSMRLRLRMRDGEYRWHESTATAERDENDTIVRWYGTSLDIHESVLLREELHDQDMVTRLLHELARRTPSLLFSLTPRGSIDFINERWSQIIGVSADHMLGFGWHQFVHTEDLERIKTDLQKHLRSGESYLGQLRLKRFDQAYRWIEIRIEAQHDDAGLILRWYGAGIDIDPQRRAIDALELLAESGARATLAEDIDTTLSRVAQASLSGIADISMFDLYETHEKTRRIVVAIPSISAETIAIVQEHASPQIDQQHPISAAMRTHECALIPVIDETFIREHVVPPARQQAWRTAGLRSLVIAPLVIGEKVLGALSLMRTRTTVPFDQQDVRVVEEIARRTAVAIENIRLRKLAHAESMERDEHFRRIADAIPQLMWVANRDGLFEWVNQRWFDFTGQTSEEAMAEGWHKIIHPDDEALARSEWQHASKMGTIYECEFRLRGIDGTYCWFLGRAAPVETALGLKWYGTNTDIDDTRRATRTLNVFADIGEAMTESLGLQATLDAVMQVVVPEFADWAFIALASENEDLHVAAIYHMEAEKSTQLATQIGKLYSVHATTRTREPRLYQHATYKDAIRDVERDVIDVFWHVAGYNSILIIPLVVGSQVRGTLTICMSESQRRFLLNDVPFFTELGRRIAPAIANAELYERERRVAQSFQNAALPAALPIVAGYAFSAIYEAGRAEALVGGDWYDAFKLLDGRIVVSIGDVAGSGLRAAVTMSNIRQAIRGVAHVHADPELMLEAADRALRTEHGDTFATAFVGVIDPIADTISYKSAGHPPAYVWMPDGHIEELRTGGLPLGLRSTDRAPSIVRKLVVGNILYFYTDGLIESTHDLEDGERRLKDAITTTQGVNSSERAAAIARAVLVDESRDDVAIMCIDVVQRLEPQRWMIDAHDIAATKISREEILLAINFGNTSEQFCIAAELILAEVVGNLLRHAPYAAEIVLEWDGANPIMHVRDNGPGFEFSPKLPPDLYSETGRGLFLISSLAADFNVTRRPEGGSHTRVVFMTSATTHARELRP